MKHYVYFKYGRVFWEKIYECWCDKKTGEDFKVALSKQYNQPLIMCEVL